MIMNPEDRVQFDAMKGKMADIDKKLDKLIDVVVGDEDFHEDGMVKKVRALEGRLDTLEEKISNIKWLAIGILFAAGVLGFNLGDLVSRLFNK